MIYKFVYLWFYLIEQLKSSVCDAYIYLTTVIGTQFASYQTLEQKFIH